MKEPAWPVRERREHRKLPLQKDEGVERG